MSGEDLVVSAIGVVLFGLPIIVTGWLAKTFMDRRRLEQDELGERGSVHTAEMGILLAIIIFGCGAVLAGVGAIPVVVWIVERDPEARRVALALVLVFLGFTTGAALMAWPGLRFWIVEDDRVTVRRLGRERSIPFASITELRERTSIGGLVEIRSDASSIRVPKQAVGFDDFLSLVRLAAPDVPYRGLRRQKAAEGNPSPVPPIGETATYAVSTVRTRLIFGFLGSLFLFFMVWPWFLVTGEHPTRDSFIFMGIGAVIWLALFTLIAQESFQRDQPAQLELRPSEIAFRQFRTGWQTRPANEMVSASVETDIIYVKGMPGYRHPLFLLFTDGTRVEIDDFRARHLGASTHELARELHRRYFDATLRPVADRAESDRLGGAATQAEQRGDWDNAITLHQQSIAAYPDATRRERYRRVGDLQREQGDHRAAVSSYRAHLDFAPNDTAAWEGLAASLREQGRDDLAGEAIQAAERLLLNGISTPGYR